MDFIFYFTILFLFIMSFFIIKQDIISRKVSNKFNLLLFIFSLILLLLNFNKIDYISFIFIFIVILLSLVLHYNKVWVAAD